MGTQKYEVNQYMIQSVLAKVREGEIAIPEIQRPFVWEAWQVRDLLDSLYKGYPVGYLIAWRNPDVRLKDGSTAQGRMILIDGQQRVTALTAAVLAGDAPPAFRAGLGNEEQSIGAGSAWVFGPFETARFLQDDGTFGLTLTPAAGTIAGTVRVYALPTI